uniref:TAR-protein n=1 Tax=Philodina roseola TaxID=96448 RepID=B2L3K5_PHIRO|nr:TAR-protein [Philodina roseola]
MFIRVVDESTDDNEIVEIPLDGGADAFLSLSTLAAQFQGVTALKYRHPETSVWRGVRVVDGKLYHPDGRWDPDMVYVTVYSKSSPTIDVKRKGDQNDEFAQESIGEIKEECENDPNRRCVDLIVLGISYRSLEADIKRDANGQSRGFGFIRFKNYESQLAVINKRHFIDGRHVDVKIPDSKTSVHEPECARKIFVARLPDNITPDDLRQYFSKYGAIKDVYIPKPARSFAFVTFHDSNIVRQLFGTHIIHGCSVTVGPAEPKNKTSTIGDYPSSHINDRKLIIIVFEH